MAHIDLKKLAICVDSYSYVGNGKEQGERKSKLSQIFKVLRKFDDYININLIVSDRLIVSSMVCDKFVIRNADFVLFKVFYTPFYISKKMIMSIHTRYMRTGPVKVNRLIQGALYFMFCFEKKSDRIGKIIFCNSSLFITISQFIQTQHVLYFLSINRPIDIRYKR